MFYWGSLEKKFHNIFEGNENFEYVETLRSPSKKIDISCFKYLSMKQ